MTRSVLRRVGGPPPGSLFVMSTTQMDGLADLPARGR
jgi:hypothetical protein